MGIDSDEWKFFSKICKQMENDGLTEWTGDCTGSAFIKSDRIGQKLEFKAFPGLWEIVDIINGTVSCTSGGKKQKDEEKYPIITIRKISSTGLALKGTSLILSQHVDKESHGLLKEGTICIEHRDGDLVKVVKFSVESQVNYEKTNNDQKNNPLQKEVRDDVVIVHYREERGDYKGFLGEAKRPDENADDKKLRKTVLSNFLNNHAILEYATVEEYEAAMKELVDTNKFPAELEDSGHEGEAGLVSVGSKDYLTTVENRMQRQRNMAQVIQLTVKRMLERQRRDLEHIRQKAYAMIEAFQKKLKKIHRLIATLEIYLGVQEGVIQISEGAAAPEGTPISLRQMRLYMDEEVGDTNEQGIDANRIHEFDEWVVKDGNFKKIMPEERGVVILAPRRRDDKDYGERQNATMRILNKWTYVLIRNGDNLYRIYSEHIASSDRLFPKRKDLQKMLDHMGKLEKYQNEISKGESSFAKMSEQEAKELFGYDKSFISESDIEDSRDKIKDELFYYQRNILMLQGIIFRTDIFAPIPEGLNLLNPDTYGDKVQFIYDDEETLPSGKLSFMDWQDKINSEIKKGSRIVMSNASTNRGYRGGTDRDRFVINFNKHNTPSAPTEGLYTVEEYVKVTEHHKRITVTPDEYLKMLERCKETTREWVGEQLIYAPYLEVINEWDMRRLQSNYKNYKGHSAPEFDATKLPINAEILTYDLGDDGKKILIVEKTPFHCVRYNPGDTVYGSWGDYDPHTRKVPLTYLIYQDDSDILNYDGIDLADINFYLESRTDREHYYKMLPVLRTIKKHLLEETEWEKGFVTMLAANLKAELGIPDIDVEPAIWDAIKWWKTEIVVWKRPINKNDAKALTMITQQVKRILRDKHGYKKLDTGVDNHKKVLVYQHDDRNVYFATGVTKKQFIDAIWDKARYSIKLDGGSRASIERAVTDTKREHIVKLATAEPDTLHMCTKAQYLGETPIKNK